MKRIAVILLILIFITVAGFASEEKIIEKTFKFSESGEFVLKNINGTIFTKTHKKDSVQIKAILKADNKEDLNNIKINFEPDADKYLKVYTEFKKSGFFFSKNNSGKVDFEVLLPEKIKIVRISTVNGKIEVRGILRDLNCHSVNGRVNVEAETKDISMKNVNGSLNLYLLGSLRGNIKAKTVNGKIELKLNKRAGFSVKGSTVNGSIRSDFDLNIEKKLVGNSVSGTVNSGDYKIITSTVNGSVSILKR